MKIRFKKNMQTTFGIIRIADHAGATVYCVRDIARALGYKNDKAFRNIDAIDIGIKTRVGTRMAKFVTLDILTNMLARSNKINSAALANEMGIDIVVKIERVEDTTINFIMQCLPLEMTRQYRVGNYKVDLYIPELNIVVECDENDHKYYDRIKEMQRTAMIDLLIKPKWIRYNPDDGTSSVINQIVICMIEKYKQ